jgi:hypothetical protein
LTLVTDTDPTPDRPRRPATGPVQYRGEDLEPERGPGLGCFRFQAIVLVVLLVLTPLTVVWEWPAWISAVLLFAIIGLLLITGQTIIFLLRLVAADRRGRRRPLASGTKTIGELEDEQAAASTESEPATEPEHEPAAELEPGAAAHTAVEPPTSDAADPATNRDKSGPP